MKGNEATYTIPLRKEYRKGPKYQQAKKAVKATREFLVKHAKAPKVELGSALNKKLFESGRQNVAKSVQVRVIKDEDKFKAELVGFPIILEKEKKEAEEKKAKGKDTKKEETKAEKESKELVDAAKKEEQKKPEKVVKKLPDKEESEKSRHEKTVTKKETPKHEKKK